MATNRLPANWADLMSVAQVEKTIDHFKKCVKWYTAKLLLGENVRPDLEIVKSRVMLWTAVLEAKRERKPVQHLIEAAKR